MKFALKTANAPYDSQANSYDRRWRRYIAHTLTFLKVSVACCPSDRILDVGCGTGEFERLILSEHPEQPMVGVDISEKMLSAARQKNSTHSSATFLRANASALPFPDNSFDLVVSASAFHYFDQPMASLREMRRVLAPGGSVVILDWCKDYLICRLFDFVLKRIEPGYQACYTQRELSCFLESAALQVRSGSRRRVDPIWGLMIATAVPKDQ